nr:hypothetical protein [Tanacetum cinerariifolium]
MDGINIEDLTIEQYLRLTQENQTPNMVKKVDDMMMCCRVESRNRFFWGNNTLFETMMVQAPEEVGEIPTDTQDTPILTQLSSSQPRGSTNQGGSKGKKQRFLKMSHQLRNIYLHLPMIHYLVTNQAVEIEKLKKRVKKLEGMKKKRTHGLKRLYKVGLSTRVESSKEEEDLGDQEDASKQRRIAEIDDDEDLSLINETIQDRGRINKEDLFRKDQIAIDEEIARKLEPQMKAEMEEEERIAREKVEANIAVVEQ